MTEPWKFSWRIPGRLRGPSAGRQLRRVECPISGRGSDAQFPTSPICAERGARAQIRGRSARAARRVGASTEGGMPCGARRPHGRLRSSGPYVRNRETCSSVHDAERRWVAGNEPSGVAARRASTFGAGLVRFETLPGCAAQRRVRASSGQNLRRGRDAPAVLAALAGGCAPRGLTGGSARLAARCARRIRRVAGNEPSVLLQIHMISNHAPSATL
jgi:hypothetical protein